MYVSILVLLLIRRILHAEPRRTHTIPCYLFVRTTHNDQADPVSDNIIIIVRDVLVNTGTSILAGKLWTPRGLQLVPVPFYR